MTSFWPRLTRVAALVGCAAAAAGAQQRPPAAPRPPVGAVSGVVIDATTRRPIEGVNIQLGPPPSRAGRLGNQFTDERGRFAFTDVGEGTYFINAIKAGYADGHYGAGVNGALGGSIVLGNGEWFDAATIQMARLGAIGGRVVDERGEPIVGAYVRVLTRFMLAGVEQLAAGPATTTDDLGEYRISGLTTGKYVVMVPSVQHSVPASASLADIEGLPADRLAARDAQAARTGVAPVRRSGGALADGLTTLILGNYITPPPPVDGRLQAYPAVFHPGATSLVAATSVTVEPGGDASGINITMSPVPAVRVSGRLEGPFTNYAGYVLRLMPAGLENLGEGSEAATAAVRADGSFTFLGVPAGAYTLMAPGSTFEYALRRVAVGLREPGLPSTPGLGGRGGQGGVVSGAPGLGFNTHTAATIADDHAGFVRMPLAVGAADIADLAVPLLRTASIHGRIVYEGFPGAPPFANVTLEPASASAALGHYSSSGGGTARDTFEIVMVLPGDYMLRVPNLTVKSVVVDGQDYSRRPIGLDAGRDAAMTLTITGQPITLSGSVRDARGVPVPLGMAVAFPTDRTLWTNYGRVQTWIRPSVGTSNGSYQITNIRAGEYYLVGIDPAQSHAWIDPAFLQSAAPAATRVTLDWGETRSVDVTIMVKR